MPKVSVVIPNYNHAPYLEQRIRSVLDQTFQDFEVIFLDDASTDGSWEVFETFAGDPRISHLHNAVNSGSPFKQWNRGVKHASGEYLWIAESDDYADPRLLDTLVRRLDANPDVGVAYCQSWKVDESGRRQGSMLGCTADLDPVRWTRDFVASGPDECSRFLVVKNTIPNASAVLIRRSIYDRVGGADESFTLAGDWMLWAKVLLDSNLAFVAEALNYFRHHRGTVRARTLRSAVNLEEGYYVSAHIVRNIAVPREVMGLFCERQVSLWFDCLRHRSMTIRRGLRTYRIARRPDPSFERRLAMYASRRLMAWTWRRLGRGGARA